MLKEITLTGAVTGLLASAALVAAPVAGAEAPHAKSRPTSFAMSGGGYASFVKGGDVPAGSDRTAFAVLGCTNKAGISHTNDIATADAGGLKLNGAKTRVWTTKRGNTVTTWARHSIAKVSLLDTPLGSLYLSGVSSKSRAWHDNRGFHARTKSTLASIVLDPAVGPNQSFPVPSPGQEADILGLITVGLGKGTTRHSRTGAVAFADALHVKVGLTDTEVFLGHSRAAIQSGVKNALFGGSAYGAKADVLEGVVTTGATPQVLMPCQGTNGKLRKNSTAHVNLSPGVNVSVLKAAQRAKSAGDNAVIVEKSSLARVSLGEGLVIRGVVGRAQVKHDGTRYRKSIAGTSPGLVILNGEELKFPKTGVLEIPGLARIESTVVKRTSTGIAVTAVRVKLLDERLATINLGYARASIRPSGN